MDGVDGVVKFNGSWVLYNGEVRFSNGCLDTRKERRAKDLVRI